MTLSVDPAQIVRQSDGSYTGVWGQFILKSAFQPIFAFGEGRLKIAAYEGLVRPFSGADAVAPALFFPMVPAVERQRVETLARTLHLLNAGRFLDRGAEIFINFDPSLFAERAVTDALLREMRLVLREAAIEPGRVVCEVTEQKSSSEAALFGFVEALRGYGFRIAVDDYGSDDSDIHRIGRLRPDIVKFDARWISSLMDSGPGYALLAEMVATFKARGIDTVFEGIEYGWQLELAEKSGASMVQGFVLARPEIVPTSFSPFTPAAATQSDEDTSRAPVAAEARAP
ncbi:MAG: EAL domain-containing protein, partial [Mesorhizobium sp.]|nr:EAL domain-containing protein [Mesorhizobium sp.]